MIERIQMSGKLFQRSNSKGFLSILFVAMFFLCLLIPGVKGQQKIYDDLFSASFPNEKEGWASGRWGCILHTADGGKTWVRQNTGTNLTLSSVFFVDEKNGWAVGEEGCILHTADGGKTWEKQKSPASLFHMKVYFVGPLKGWIVSEGTHILYTEDGGKTWTKQYGAIGYNFNSLFFMDDTTGVAVGNGSLGGTILKTYLGNSSWIDQPSGVYDELNGLG